MKWFLGIATSRFNRRHKLFGQSLRRALQVVAGRRLCQRLPRELVRLLLVEQRIIFSSDFFAHSD
jgi:hypothetical protein